MASEDKQFVIDFDDEQRATPPANDKSEDKQEEKTTVATIDPNALAEALAAALVKAQALQAHPQPAPEPQRDPAEIELENARKRLAEIEQQINDLTMTNPESPQLGQLILERESVRGRIGDLEATLPLKRQMSQVQEQIRLAQQVPFQVDKLVAMAEPHLAKFGPKASELRIRLRAELAQAAQHDPAALFNEDNMMRIIRAWIGEQAFNLGLVGVPYDPATGGGAPPPKDENAIEEERWRRAIKAIGLDPDKVMGGKDA